MDKNSVLDALIDALQTRANSKGLDLGRKHDLADGFSLTTNFMHGVGGIFGVPGIERDVIATRVKPRGLLNVLPARGSVVEQPVFAYLTGFTDDENGAEKDGVCATPLEAGEIKSCYQGAQFGRFERKTEPLELNAVGRMVNRGEMFDLRLLNDELLAGDNLMVPGSIPNNASQILNSEVLARWMTVGVAMERLLGPKVYTGDPTNNSGGGGYKEFLGLETLVGTGKVDVFTGTACPSLDSDVRDFGNALVDADTMTIFRMLTDMFRNLRDIASRTGLDPVEWVIVMRSNLFNELADLWPCAYGTYRCGSDGVFDSSVVSVNIDGMSQRQLSDEIRNGRYLLLDGIRVPVVLDDFIPEVEVAPGQFTSDIYVLPLTVRGGYVSTYFEYVDFQNAGGVMSQITQGRLGNEYWTDGGRFLWTYHRTGWCAEWWVKTEPRLILRTPHLAGRIQNVGYAPLTHFREDDPASAYFFNGGEVARDNSIYNYLTAPE